MSKSDYQMEIIRIIRNHREAIGWGQKNVASFLGISIGHVGSIESPRFPHKYTLNQLNKLCQKFGMPTEQLFIPDEAYMEDNINITELLINKICEYED